MSVRITECSGIGETAAEGCDANKSTTAAIVPCTVTSDVCSLPSGAAAVKPREPETEEAKGELDEDGCCCEC